MLISGGSDGKESKDNRDGDIKSNNYDYDTANELFELIGKNHQIGETAKDDTMTTDDLVILYKNLDVGTNLITEAKYSQTKPSNQYVENVIYKDEHDSDESDIDDICSTEDIRNIMMINKERIDLLNNTTSFENTLCKTFGNISMNASNLSATYNKQCLFKDPYIKEKLNNVIPVTTDTDVLPSSLLDYICCKRLEDNYNFYMDNIIRYVEHTIEQLKRISNGDYLTDRAKEKWREVDHVFNDTDAKETVLANSVSIPLHVERKFDGVESTWDDVVHSEIDVRSLSRMLEKKIVVEIPRLICGTFKLFSKCYNDNLIISCKKEINALNETHSRVDVVLKLKKSESGHVISKLDSIMILQTSQQISIEDPIEADPLAICQQIESVNAKTDDIPKIIEVHDADVTTSDLTYEHGLLTNDSPETYDDSIIGVDTEASTASFPCNMIYNCKDSFLTHATVIDGIKSYSDEQTEANFRLMSPNELRYSIQRLNMSSPVPEEFDNTTKKKKSSTKIRIKSPYENSSHAVEEKRRRRLLEIRERREIKKKSLNENCKISKHKHGKSAVMAQASSSVTKLSITNKSFYDSIYGQSINIEANNSNKDRRIQTPDLEILVELEHCEEENKKKSPRSFKNKEKYINHSYYLDDADTEIKHLKLKDCSHLAEGCRTSSSGVSEELGSGLNLLKDILSLSKPPDQMFSILPDFEKGTEIQNEKVKNNSSNLLKPTISTSHFVPSNTPKESPCKIESNKDEMPSIECRKSIDKIYDLIKKLEKKEMLEFNMDKDKVCPDGDEIEDQIDSKDSIQLSESGTSLKHHLASCIPSCYSFKKATIDPSLTKNINKKSEIPTSAPLKVGVGSSKIPVTRLSDNKQKRDRKKTSSPVRKISENPLNAISQLLREFENVQKRHHKTVNDGKSNKKYDGDKKNNSRQVTMRKPFLSDNHLKNNEPTSRVSTPKDKKSKLYTHIGKSQNAKPIIDEKPVDKLNRRKITDIMDEVKEARGEAVRGPPKSRLESLAQPKKPYNEPHHELFPNRNRNPVNRSQKSTNSITPVDRKDAVNIKIRSKKGPELSAPQKYHSTVPPLGIKRSESSSPVGNRKRSPVLAFGPSHKANVPEAPETLLKKMVAVESYVNNHYGRGSPTQDLKDFSGAQKSRVPLIPTDLDIDSMTSSRTAEESTILGKKLHYMIDTMISTTAPGLSSLCEKNEMLLSSDSLNEAFVDTVEQFEDLSNTEFPIDVFGDKSITTAVASLAKDTEGSINNNIDINLITYDIQPFNSLTELARLENALYRRLSAGTFQKRLRMKNLTLTPKHSLQQVLVLQSGDVGSLVVKSTLSHNVIKKTSSKTNILPEVKSNLKQSLSHVDWTFSNFPSQQASVGYAVPTTTEHVEPTKIKPEEQILNEKGLKKDKVNQFDVQFNKTNQYINGSQQGKVQNVQIEAIVQGHVNKAISQNDENQIASKTSLDKNNTQLKKNEEGQVENEISNILQSQCETNNKNEIKNNTTSLDILVGLLNEIKNITTCQTHLTENKTADVEEDERNTLEFILRRADFQENSVNPSPQKSRYSLDNLDQQNLLCNVYMPNYNIFDTEILSNNNPFYADKEVNVNINGIEYVHTLTDVPSQLFPLTVHHSTNVTRSLISIISEPSEQSVYYFSDYHTLYCNSSFNKIVELPKAEPRKSCHSLIPIYKKSEKSVIEIKENTNEKSRTSHENISEIDRIIKVKRDFLITIYSLLVMTVFAALSFQEIFYRL